MKSIKQILGEIVYKDPSNEMPAEVISMRGAEDGLDHIEIITRSNETKWKHRIYTEEM